MFSKANARLVLFDFLTNTVAACIKSSVSFELLTATSAASFLLFSYLFIYLFIYSFILQRGRLPATARLRAV